MSDIEEFVRRGLAAQAAVDEELAKFAAAQETEIRQPNGVVPASESEPCEHETVSLDGSVWVCDDCPQQFVPLPRWR